MAVGENHRGIGMDFAALQPRHPMVDAPRQFPDFGVQRAAEGDVHLLQAAADAEQGYAARDAGLRQRQRQAIALQVVGLVAGVRFGAKMRRVNVGPGAGQDHAVDDIQQRTDIGDFGAAGEHQRQRAGDLGHRAKITLAGHLRRKPILDAIGVGDYPDDRPPHCLASNLTSQISHR